MSNGVSFVAFIDGHQPYLSRLDDPHSVRANLYINQNVVDTVPGSRSAYSIIVQDVIAGLGYPYVRRSKSKYYRHTIAFFKDDIPYMPPSTFEVIGDPESISSNEFHCWVRPFRGDGAIIYPNALVDFYQRAILNTSIPEYQSMLALLGPSAPSPSPSLSLVSSQALAIVPSYQRRPWLQRDDPSRASNHIKQNKSFRDFSSSTSDLEPTHLSMKEGYEAEISRLKEQVEDCRNELLAAHQENARLSRIVCEQEDYTHDIVSAMERMSTNTNGEVGHPASSSRSGSQEDRGHDSPHLPPAYDDTSPPTQGSQDLINLTPTFVDGVQHSFNMPYQSFGECVDAAIERFRLPRAAQIHDLCFKISNDTPLNRWQATLANSRLVGAHAREIMDAMEMDIRMEMY